MTSEEIRVWGDVLTAIAAILAVLKAWSAESKADKAEKAIQELRVIIMQRQNLIVNVTAGNAQPVQQTITLEEPEKENPEPGE